MALIIRYPESLADLNNFEKPLPQSSSFFTSTTIAIKKQSPTKSTTKTTKNPSRKINNSTCTNNNNLTTSKTLNTTGSKEKKKMSSSLAANVARCAANAAAKSAAVVGCDDDLAYLQEKPSVGRKSGGGGNSKAKRNTYIKHLLKQNENRAVVGKVLTNDKELSKKRRDRLLSQLNDDLSIDVEYSLNRKNRWETISTAADLVKSSDEPDGIQVTGVDAHYGVGLSKVSAYHQLDADGYVSTKKCSKPLNGVALESLLHNKDGGNEKQRGKKRSKRLALAKLEIPSAVADGDDDVEKKPHVRYILRKPHPIPQLFGGSLFKRPAERLHKTRGRMDKIDTDYLDDIEMTTSVHGNEQDEYDMSASVAAFYKAPRQSTFSLADFIKDSSPPVMVHSKSIESIADSSDKGSDKVTATTSSASASTGSSPGISKTKMSSKTYFEEFEILKAQMGVTNFVEAFEKLSLRSELKFRWLNNEKNRCVFDLTHLLDEHTFKIAMVVVVEALKSKEGYLRVLINGSFGCPSDVTEYVKVTTFNSPGDFIEELIKKVQKCYNDARLSTKNSSLASYNSVFHGHQLTLPVDPCGDYKIIEDAAARAPTVEAIIIDGPESEEDDDDDAEMEGFEEFEVIEMDDIISEVDEDEAKEAETKVPEEPEIIEDYDSGCDMCPEGNEDELIILDSCGHRFCRSCIRQDLTDAIVRRSAYPLMCLHDNCGTPINLDFLVTILPLSIVEYYFRFAFMAENISDGKSVVECPHCHGSAAVEKKPTFGSVKCTKCSICFCARCDRQPHFPLSCQQMDIWEKKFEKQYPVDVSRQTQGKTYKCECGEMIQNPKGLRQVTCHGCNISYTWKTGEAIVRDGIKKPLTPIDVETLPNNIAGEFSKICSISRTLRYDLTANRQITKNLCKVVDFRLKQAFIEIRKTALHILEYGFAWLYLNNKRGQKSSAWSTIKAQLTLLRTKLDALHSQIANGQTDGSIEAKINELNNLTQKCLDDFVVHA